MPWSAPACVTRSMSGLDHVLSRFRDDPEFRESLTHRPREALEGYRLDRAELEELRVRLAKACDCTSVADHRCALAGLLRLLALTASAAPDSTDP